MQENRYITLTNRAIIAVHGEEAKHFLQNLITTDIVQLGPGELLPGALLTPQGKVKFDFLIGLENQGYLIEINDVDAANFQKVLLLYKLRAKVEITKPKQCVTLLSWQNSLSILDLGLSFRDKRFPDLLNVQRQYLDQSTDPHQNIDRWKQLRIDYAIAESHSDFSLGDVFAHDINFDQIGGLSFKKGCYIGQEVVSRMHHRQTARRRTIIAQAQTAIPEKATVIVADGQPIGTLGTILGDNAIAIIRIDRAKKAMDQGKAITAEGVPLQLLLPSNVTFSFPESTD